MSQCNNKQIMKHILTDWSNDLKHMLNHPLINNDFKIRQEIIERIDLASKFVYNELDKNEQVKIAQWIEENLHSPELNIQNQAKELKKTLLNKEKEQ